MSKATNTAQVWPVRNDQIVLMLLGGMTQAAVGREYNLSRQAIAKIAKDPRAEEIIQRARETITEKLLGDMDEQLDLASRLSMKVIRRTLNADISPTHKAKGNQDRVAVSILRGRGFLSRESETGEKGFMITPAQFDRLTEALSKADAAKKIDPFAEIPEVQVVEEDSDG